jgi:hypothetical protein
LPPFIFFPVSIKKKVNVIYYIDPRQTSHCNALL